MGGGDYSVYSADLAHDVRNDITRLHMHVATHHAEGNLHMRQVFLASEAAVSCIVANWTAAIC